MTWESDSTTVNPAGEGRKGQYLARTLRSVGVVTGFIILTLASYGQNWAIGPLLLGVGLAVALLLGWDQFVRRFFTPEAVVQAKKKKQDRRWALLAFALVKYPLVALLLWAIVRAWHTDQRRILVFLAGFLILQTVIALRAAGRALTEKYKE